MERKRISNPSLAFLLIVSLILCSFMGTFNLFKASAVEVTPTKLLMDLDFNNALLDKSENPASVTSTGTITYIEGQYPGNKAINIQNVPDPSGKPTAKNYVSLGKPAKLDFGLKSFSIMINVKVPAATPAGGYYTLMSNKDWNKGTNSGFIYDIKDNGMSYNIADGTNKKESLRQKFTFGGWQNVILTVDRSGNMVNYCDGAKIGSVDIKSIAANSLTSPNPIILGADGKLQYPAKEVIFDDLKIFDGVLTASEIVELNKPKLDINVYNDQIKSFDNKLASYNGILSTAKITAFGNVLKGIKATAPTTLDGANENINALKIAWAEAMNKDTAPVLNFQVLSDPHISNPDLSAEMKLRSDNLISGLAGIKELYPNSDGLVVTGDVTDYNMKHDWDNFYNIIDADKRDNTLIVLGNHDVDTKTSSRVQDPIKYFMEKNSKYMNGAETPYYDLEINGYQLISLSTEACPDTGITATISQEQLDWFKDTLEAKATKKDFDKPIFVFCHFPLNGTVDRSGTWNIGEADAKIKAILKDYPQVIYTSGHLHNGNIGIDTQYNSAFGTFLDVPTFLSDTDAKANEVVDSSTTAYDYSVYADGSVVVTPVNLVTKKVYLDKQTIIDRNISTALYAGSDLDRADMLATSKDGSNPLNALDGSTSTIWDVTTSADKRAEHSIAINLNGSKLVNGLRYIPATTGIITKYEILTSTDGVAFTSRKIGAWNNDGLAKYASFDMVEASHIKLVSKESYLSTDNSISSKAKELVPTFSKMSVLSVPNVAEKTVTKGTSFEALNLPTVGSVILTNGDTVDNLPIIWADLGYDGTKNGTYTLKGLITPPSYTVNGKMEVRIKVVVSAGKTILEATYNTNKDKAQGNFTDDSYAAFKTALTTAKKIIDKPDAIQSEIDSADAALKAAVAGLTEKQAKKGCGALVNIGGIGGICGMLFLMSLLFIVLKSKKSQIK